MGSRGIYSFAGDVSVSSIKGIDEYNVYEKSRCVEVCGMTDCDCLCEVVLLFIC